MKKVFCIGNSFSVDATSYVPQIAQSLGIDAEFGNLYFGGCSIDQHLDYATNNKAVYDFYTANSGSEWKITPNETLLNALQSNDWDIITMQQVSGLSGIWDSYGNLPKLMQFVKANATSNYQLYWHMTWAYQGDSTHPDFVRYGNNQQTMYQSICSCVQQLFNQQREFAKVIPNGIAIQNLRQLVGDNVTRDGFHLNNELGRYTAGLAFVKAVFDVDISQCTYLPEGVTKQMQQQAIQAVVLAFDNH